MTGHRKRTPPRASVAPPNPGLKVQPFTNFPKDRSVSTENVVFWVFYIWYTWVAYLSSHLITDLLLFSVVVAVFFSYTWLAYQWNLQINAFSKSESAETVFVFQNRISRNSIIVESYLVYYLQWSYNILHFQSKDLATWKFFWQPQLFRLGARLAP